MSSTCMRLGLLVASLGWWPCAAGCRATAPHWPWAAQPSPATVAATSATAPPKAEPNSNLPDSYLAKTMLTDMRSHLAQPSLASKTTGELVPPAVDNRTSAATAVAAPANQSAQHFSASLHADGVPRLAGPVAAPSTAEVPLLNSPHSSPSNLAPTIKPVDVMGTTPPSTGGDLSSRNSENMTLQIDGVQPGAGDVKIAIFTHPTNFPDSRFAQTTMHLPATSKQLVTDLPQFERMAIAAYQDNNRDGQLNRNRFGIPIEPYGFSNSAFSQRGPPSFAEATVAPSSLWTAGQTTITVVLR